MSAIDAASAVISRAPDTPAPALRDVATPFRYLYFADVSEREAAARLITPYFRHFHASPRHFHISSITQRRPFHIPPPPPLHPRRDVDKRYALQQRAYAAEVIFAAFAQRHAAPCHAAAERHAATPRQRAPCHASTLAALPPAPPLRVLPPLLCPPFSPPPFRFASFRFRRCFRLLLRRHTIFRRRHY